MSSEGSVASSSSRIRSFGLYRTIDAKTDEFLRSSRKRQITQGCACAAISTAITVTVVVSVILVYEYCINIDANKTKKIAIKPNRIGLANDSHTAQIDQKFLKSINLDKSSLKLLPILIKAIDENKYFEKQIEGHSSSNSPDEKTDNIDYVKRNIFSDTKNWFKMQSPKTYRLDYKTTPLIFIKRPSQHSQYLARIRKMKNYERMLNYFDKMINDKVTITKTSNTRTLNYEYTETPLTSTTKQKKVKYKTTLKHKLRQHKSVKQHKETNTRPPKESIKEHANDSIVSCKCPKNMDNLMSKLILSLQQIAPYSANISETPCANKLKNDNMQSSNVIPTSSINPIVLIHSTSLSNTNFAKIALTPSPTKKFTLPATNDSHLEETTISMAITTENFSMVSIMNDIKSEILVPEMEAATTIIKVNKPMKMESQPHHNTNLLNRTEPQVIEISTEPTTIEIATKPATTEIITQSPINEHITKPTTTELWTKATTSSMQREPITNNITTEETEVETVIIRDKIYSTTEEIILDPRYLSEQQVAKETTEFPLMAIATYMKNINKPRSYYDKIHQLNTLISQADKLATTTAEYEFKYDHTTVSSPITSRPILDPMPMYEIYDAKPTINTPVYQTRPFSIATNKMISTASPDLFMPAKFNDADEGFLSNENFAEIATAYKNPILPGFKEQDYDYVVTTQKIKKSDIYVNKRKAVEKTYNVFRKSMRKIGYRSRLSNYHPVIKKKDIDINNMRKMVDANKRLKKVIQENTTTLYNETRAIDGNNDVLQKYNSTQINKKIGKQIKKKFESRMIMKSQIDPYLSVNASDKEEKNLISQIEYLQDEDSEDEDNESEKKAESLEKIKQYYESKKKYTEESPPPTKFDKMKSVNKLIKNPNKSTVPPLRTGSLNVRQNDEWKPDDQSDYDNNE